ncbi:divalent-cation tolerance protein CutA [Phenylobacterium sp.]|uniref:divalent-cation tolerance protein CutA n=1 Tax=Phenylobacterium sp. TaxID=1871053 RepID=UPI0028118DCD|nr:divalent-cation tolerance protein CutA [Phenylobacterium sp.]
MRAIIVQTATALVEEGERIAEALLEEGLAACVQIVPIRSRYVWKGAIERQDEQLLLIKTREDLFEQVDGRILALHGYEAPEVVALPVSAGDPDYLAWIADSTKRR